MLAQFLNPLPEKAALPDSRIVFKLQYGDLFPFLPFTYPLYAVDKVEEGLNLDELLDTLLVRKILYEQFFMEIDYLADRGTVFSPE